MPSELKLYLGEKNILNGLEKLRRLHGNKNFNWGFPTVCYIRDNEVIGAVTRNEDYPDLIVIGPLLGPNLRVYLRLVDALDSYFRSIGVVKYWFFINEGDKVKSLMDKFIERCTDISYKWCPKFVSHYKGNYWYSREIGEV